MYSGGYSSYKGAGARSEKRPVPSPGSAARYGIRSSSSVPYGVTSPSYSLPLSSSTLSALALSSSSSSSMRYAGSKSTGAYSPASSASSSPRLTSYHPSSLSYSRSFTRGSDGYGSWSVRSEEATRWSAPNSPLFFFNFARCTKEFFNLRARLPRDFR